jgi:hypothetical protein
LYQAPYIDPVIENSALEPQTMEVAEKSGCDEPPKKACFSYYWLLVIQVLNLCVPNFIEGGVTENNNDQIYDSVRSIQKIRDELVCYMSLLLFQTKRCMFCITFF